ncbi:serine/threonine protein kinase [Pantoea septica]|uniref:serine/threonine protein kinase n=1 Tax=Pantoea septica TaxID=472695 RepID=UPI0028ABFDC0|nr:protein kinase [Pantoea septica]
MDVINLVRKLKAMGTISTLVGEFSFIKQIGEGGNSNVCLYTKNGLNFAVKFFSKGTELQSKADRFIDEYFGLAQIPSHPAIAEYFHLDSITIDDDKLFIIIMKRYASALNETLKDETDEGIYTEKLRILFEDLLSAIEHLHKHKIIHRDIKPQNILRDAQTGRFVLSDFGISKFDPESIAREADTREGERLANHRYCSPEQRGKSIPTTFSSDLYAFAQVIQEYATGDISQGGGRQEIKFTHSEFLRIADSVISKCLMHDPDKRFQSVSELREFMHKESDAFKENVRYMEKEREINISWDFLFKLNHAIAKGFPTVNKVGEINDPERIARFLNCINETLQKEEHQNKLWLTDSRGGDLNYYGTTRLSSNEFEINYGGSLYQANIRKIFVHYDDVRPYRNFFIILIESMPPFNYTSTFDLNVLKSRSFLPSSVDHAIQWNGKYFDPQDMKNIYVEIEDQVYKNDINTFRDVHRFVANEALLISPFNVISNGIVQNNLAQTLLNQCLSEHTLTDESARHYWQAVGGRYSSWISNRL